MQPALRLVQAPDLKLHPEDLFAALESSGASFNDLLKQFNCSLEDLKETLAAPQTTELHQLKVQVAVLRTQLIATRYAPMAVANLASLMSDAEKPEVRRRAATGILHVAGIATTTAKQEPAPAPMAPPPPPPPPPPKLAYDQPTEDLNPYQQRVMTLVAMLMNVLNQDQIPVDEPIPEGLQEAIQNAMRPFYQKFLDEKINRIQEAMKAHSPQPQPETP